MMLAEVSLFTRHLNAQFVLDNWKKWVEGNVAMTTEHVQVVVALLTIVGNAAKQLPRPSIMDIKGFVCVCVCVCWNILA